MKKSGLIVFFVLGMFLAFGETADAKESGKAKPVKIAIIGDTNKVLPQMDILTVRLSADDNVLVLDRSNWEALMRERELSASNIDADAVGKLLGADGLIILVEKESVNIPGAKSGNSKGGKGKKTKYLLTKLVAVKSGVVLDSIVSPLDKKSQDSFSLVDAIECRFKPKFAKLENPKNKVIVSMLNLRSEIASPELLAIEKDLNALFAQCLMRERNVLVSERWNMGDTSFEKDVAGNAKNEYKTASMILDGVITLKDKENIEVNLIVTDPSGGKRKFKVSGGKNDLEKLAGKLKSKCLEVAKVAEKSIVWNKRKEADQYRKEAVWAYRTGLFAKAAQSAESSWALGCRKNDLLALRIKSFLGNAFASQPVIEGPRTRLDPSRFDRHLDAGIMATELLHHYIIDKAKENPKNRSVAAFFARYNLVEMVTTTLLDMLQEAYRQKCLFKFPEKELFLRRQLNEALVFTSEHVRKPCSYPYLITMRYAPYLYQSPEETGNKYKQLLLLKSSRLKSRVPIETAIRRNNYLHYSPFFIDRSGKYSEATEKRLLNSFLKNLKGSNNPQLQVDAFAISYYPDPETLGEIYAIYNANKNKFHSFSAVIPNNVISKLPTDFIYSFAKGALEHVLKKGRVDSKFIQLSALCEIEPVPPPKKELTGKKKEDIGNFMDRRIPRRGLTEKEIENIKTLIDKCLSKYPKLKNNYSFKYVRDMFLAKFATKKALPGPKVKTIVRNEDLKGFDRVSIFPNRKLEIYNNALYEIYSKLDTKKKTVQFAVSILDVETMREKTIVCPKLKMKESPHGSPYTLLHVNNNRVVFEYRGKLYCVDLENKRSFKLDAPSLNYSRLFLRDNSLIACFEGDRNDLIDSGMIEIDIQGKGNTLICNSRRKPRQAILDNVEPYSFYDAVDLNGRLILLKTGSPVPFVVYDRRNKSLTPLEQMDAGFFRKFVPFYYLLGTQLRLPCVAENGKTMTCSFDVRKNKRRKKKKGKKGRGTTSNNPGGTVLAKLKTAKIPEKKVSLVDKLNYREKPMFLKLHDTNVPCIFFGSRLYRLNPAKNGLAVTEYASPIQMDKDDEAYWSCFFFQFFVKNKIFLVEKDYFYKQDTCEYIRRGISFLNNLP